MNETPKRKRGQRGPDKMPRKKREPIRVDPTKSIIDQVAALRPQEADLTGIELSARFKKDKRNPKRLVGAKLPIAYASAVDEMIDVFDTDKDWILKVAIAVVACRWAPGIAKKFGLTEPSITPLRSFPPTALPPHSEVTPTRAQREYDRNLAASYEETVNEGVLPPADVVLPGTAFVHQNSNGDPVRI